MLHTRINTYITVPSFNILLNLQAIQERSAVNDQISEENHSPLLNIARNYKTRKIRKKKCTLKSWMIK